ncbi:hypothetical protein GCM10020367_52080 [Streptomyces sannanensis]|uniref:Uncharacterized protein n=1 Tax=Streptomyces sannanensis TaxID=285536 RepID=A0ABP6SIH2_9ACTN
MAGRVQQDPPPIRLRLSRGLDGVKGRQPGRLADGAQGPGLRLAGAARRLPPRLSTLDPCKAVIDRILWADLDARASSGTRSPGSSTG